MRTDRVREKEQELEQLQRMLHHQEMQRMRDEVEKRQFQEDLASEKMIAAQKELELEHLRCLRPRMSGQPC